MAARRNPAQDQATREKIRTTQLLKRLEANSLGELDKELSPSQVRSIEILLRKTIPDLSNVEVSGNPDRPFKIEFGWAK
jgi:hypothetical protein